MILYLISTGSRSRLPVMQFLLYNFHMMKLHVRCGALVLWYGTCDRLNSSGSINLFYFFNWRVSCYSQQRYFFLLLLLLQHTRGLFLDHIDLLLNFGDSKSTLDNKSDPNQRDDRAFSAEICSGSENRKRVCQEFDGSISSLFLEAAKGWSQTRCASAQVGANFAKSFLLAFAQWLPSKDLLVERADESVDDKTKSKNDRCKRQKWWLAEKKDGVNNGVDGCMCARRFDHIRRINQLIGVNNDVLVLTPGLFDFSHCAHVLSLSVSAHLQFC